MSIAKIVVLIVAVFAVAFAGTLAANAFQGDDASVTTGAQGPTGEDGQPGEDGADGVDGPPGPTGPAGVDGATGPRGFNGSDGDDGANGARGATGPQGATGPAGATGPIGLPGASGPAGADGADGADGDNVSRMAYGNIVSSLTFPTDQPVTVLEIANIEPGEWMLEYSVARLQAGGGFTCRIFDASKPLSHLMAHTYTAGTYVENTLDRMPLTVTGSGTTVYLECKRATGDNGSSQGFLADAVLWLHRVTD